MRVHEVAELFEELAPRSLAAEWDNPGWQIRLGDEDVRGALVGLDPDPRVIDEALVLGANLLLTHHPLFLHAPRTIDAHDLVGLAVLTAVRTGVSIFTLHTNLDAAVGGTSWALAEALGLEGGALLQPGPDPSTGYGVIAEAAERRTLAQWASIAQDRLGAAPLAVSGEPNELHGTIAVMGGSGATQLDQAAAAGASLCLTADVRYHEAQRARAAGLSLILLDHFASEQPVLARIVSFLRTRVPFAVACSTLRTSPWE